MLLGALLLIAPLSAALTVAAVDMLAGFVGVALDGPVGLLVSLGAAVVGLEVAAETAAVRLHGFAVLDRGGRSRCAIRYASVGATVLSGLVVAVVFLADVLGWLLSVRGSRFVAAAANTWVRANRAVDGRRSVSAPDSVLPRSFDASF